MARLLRIASREVTALALTVAAIAVAPLLAGGRAEAAASIPFLPHQALYDLSLVKSRGSNSINSARGRILYNFSGSACEGYTSEFRQVSELDSGEDKVTLERSALDLLGGRRGQELSLQDRDANERQRRQSGRRRCRADRRPCHGQIEAAGRPRPLRSTATRCFRPSRSSASSRRRAQENRCSSSRSMTAPTMARRSTTRFR